MICDKTRRAACPNHHAGVASQQHMLTNIIFRGIKLFLQMQVFFSPLQFAESLFILRIKKSTRANVVKTLSLTITVALNPEACPQHLYHLYRSEGDPPPLSYPLSKECWKTCSKT